MERVLECYARVGMWHCRLTARSGRPLRVGTGEPQIIGGVIMVWRGNDPPPEERVVIQRKMKRSREYMDKTALATKHLVLFVSGCLKAVLCGGVMKRAS